MTRRFFLTVSLCSAALMAAACGTAAPAVFTLTETPSVVDGGEVVAQISTATVMPTATTKATSTAAPTVAPTQAPTAEATEAVTEAPAADAAIGGADYGADDPQKFAVDNFGNAANGEKLFNQTFSVDGAEWMCSTCHNAAGDEVKIGPSLYNVGLHALSRVADEGPYTYIYTSIHNSQAYIVPGFEDKTHMPVFEGVLTDSQIYDLTKYLLTLHD